MIHKIRLFLILVFIIVFSACQRGTSKDGQLPVQISSETPIPESATATSTKAITSTATYDVLKTTIARVTKTAIVKLTESALYTSTPVPTETQAQQVFGWDAYTPISIYEIFKMGESEIALYEEGFTFYGEKYVLKGEYQFERRPLEGSRESMFFTMIYFMYSSQFDVFREAFQEELLFEIEGEKYWIPVQSVLVSDYDELIIGQDIDIYIGVLGISHHPDGDNWVFMNNAFVECDIANCK